MDEMLRMVADHGGVFKHRDHDRSTHKGNLDRLVAAGLLTKAWDGENAWIAVYTVTPAGYERLATLDALNVARALPQDAPPPPPQIRMGEAGLEE